MDKPFGKHKKDVKIVKVEIDRDALEKEVKELEIEAKRDADEKEVQRLNSEIKNLDMQIGSVKADILNYNMAQYTILPIQLGTIGYISYHLYNHFVNNNEYNNELIMGLSIFNIGITGLSTIYSRLKKKDEQKIKDIEKLKTNYRKEINKLEGRDPINTQDPWIFGFGRGKSPTGVK